MAKADRISAIEDEAIELLRRARLLAVLIASWTPDPDYCTLTDGCADVIDALVVLGDEAGAA